jgi:hypothetical protein
MSEHGARVPLLGLREVSERRVGKSVEQCAKKREGGHAHSELRTIGARCSAARAIFARLVDDVDIAISDDLIKRLKKLRAWCPSGPWERSTKFLPMTRAAALSIAGVL